jgi:hypothetical protein
MLFDSLTFVVFFVVVVTTYWSIRSWQARKNFLVVASYIFYGAWNPPFAALLHYQDFSELAGFNCPEWSHLTAGDSVEFTKRLVPHLRTALGM